jgi:CRISPR-associated endonuclease/helicase Cas3
MKAGRIPSEAPNDFRTAFGFAPRPLQHVVNQAPLEQIAVLEGETGSGKTEAALWYWRRLHDAGLVDGLYFALPTRSAGVQIHERVTNALTKLWGFQAPVCVLAVPGYIRADDYLGHRLPGWEVLWDDNAKGTIRHERWAAEALRRFLSAYVAVGTVDQAMLSALRVTHSAQRASVLARSLLIVDEVHASDAYMGAILVRLVRHHVACGGYFLALSATLGASLRNALMVTPARDLRTSLNVAYPAMHVGATVIPIPNDRSRTVSLTTTSSDATVQLIRRALADDAAVLTVRNTVADAIETARLLEMAGVTVLLHHGRYAPEDRRELDRAVEQTLGRDRKVGSVCVVGTQTLEQSLDIDADVLITDLCPMDVLLQRAGRLHRHQRPVRPQRWAAPQAIVLVPNGGIEPLLTAKRSPQGLGRVYRDLRAIQLTLEEIVERGQIRIPADCRAVIERTTHPEVLVAIGERSPAWLAWGRQVDGEATGARGIAAVACVDRSIPWGDRRIVSARGVGDDAATRLGARDMRVEVNWPGAVVPIVRSVMLPGRLLPGVDPMTIRLKGAEIYAGRWCFTYGRFGLEWTRI